MPYAINDGVRIYYEIEGNGPPLVLAHGFSGSIEHWKRYGHVDQLKEAHRLILVDARGHGRSDHPTAVNDYSWEVLARDLTSVLESIRVERAHFIGFSMGGALGFSLMWQAPQRLASAILMGASPYFVGFGSALRDAIAGGPDALIALLERSGRKIPEWRRQIVLEADFKAWAAYLDAPVPREEWTAAARRFVQPCLVLCGDQDENFDGAKRLASEMPNATFVGFPGQDHGGPMMNPDVSLPHVKRFLEGITLPAAARRRASPG